MTTSTTVLTLNPNQLKIIDRPNNQSAANQSPPPRRFKVVVLGSSSVGKTALLGRIISGQFGEYGSTIGGDIYLKTINVDISGGDEDPILRGQSSVQLLFYDTSGNERYGLLLGDAMAKASAAIIVYDVTDRGSFEAVDNWLAKFRASVSNSSLVLLVGTKTDLLGTESPFDEIVITVEAEEKASRLNALFCQVSSKNGQNIDELTRLLGASLMASAVNQRLTINQPLSPLPPGLKADKTKGMSLESVREDQFSAIQPLFKFKIAILGERAVGKTSILTQFLYNSFDPNYQSTIGIDFFSKNVYVDGRTVRLQLWDTAGQERFRSLIPSYIRSSSAAIIVYDVTDRHSFNEVKYWVQGVRCERGTDAVLMLAANKTDLRVVPDEDPPNPRSMVTTQEGEAKAREIGAFFIEVSAKTGYNVQQLFLRMAAALPESVITSSDAGHQGAVNVEAISTDENAKDGSWCSC